MYCRKLYLWRVKVRGMLFWCHEATQEAALVNLEKQTEAPLREWCLEWQIKNLDGSDIPEDELIHICFEGKLDKGA